MLLNKRSAFIFVTFALLSLQLGWAAPVSTLNNPHQDVRRGFKSSWFLKGKDRLNEDEASSSEGRKPVVKQIVNFIFKKAPKTVPQRGWNRPPHVPKAERKPFELTPKEPTERFKPISLKPGRKREDHESTIEGRSFNKYWEG